MADIYYCDPREHGCGKAVDKKRKWVRRYWLRESEMEYLTCPRCETLFHSAVRITHENVRIISDARLRQRALDLLDAKD